VEGDDFNEPICDAVRGILDGHIILSRDLGSAGHYPAIDILQSVSRLAASVSTKEQKEHARKIREAMAAYRRAEDLINLGAYASGSNPGLDAAIRVRGQLEQFLRQDASEKACAQETLAKMSELSEAIG
jgi:flagellum-specific ATP synthase